MKSSDITVGQYVAWKEYNGPTWKLQVLSKPAGGDFRAKVISPDGSLPYQVLSSRQLAAHDDVTPQDDGIFTTRVVEPWTHADEELQARVLNLATRTQAVFEALQSVATEAEMDYLFTFSVHREIDYARVTRVVRYGETLDVPVTLLEKLLASSND